jgi:hypothetical protein
MRVTLDVRGAGTMLATRWDRRHLRALGTTGAMAMGAISIPSGYSRVAVDTFDRRRLLPRRFRETLGDTS